jgi:hypothetical protein
VSGVACRAARHWLLGIGCCLAALPLSLASAQELPQAEPPVAPATEDGAAAIEPEWHPVPPGEEVWDWIQLTSGEWLKGTILRLRDDRFEFDSERMKEVSFKWRHIKEIHSASPRVWRFNGGLVLIGPGVMRDDSVAVSVDGAQREMPRRSLLAILPGAGKEEDRWRAKATLSAALREGNTDQFDLSVDAWARRETAKTRLRFDYNNVLGTLDGKETNNMHRGTGRFDYYYTHKLFFIPGYLEAFHDPFTNINIRLIGSAGLGYHISRGIFDWVVYSTAGYQYQGFSSTEEGEAPSESNGAVLLGTTFEWEITADLDWNSLYQLQLTFPRVGDTSHRMTTALRYDITRVLLLETALHFDRVEQPRTDATGRTPAKNDLRLTVGFGLQY